MRSANNYSLGVFCGSSMGNSAIYCDVAIALAEAMSSAGITLVYGGANVGIMGVLANHLLAKGGKAIGVIPQSLVDVELAHGGLTALHVVDSMHERKALMSSLSQGFIMLPGGTGTLDEFFEMVTWAQLSYHNKPCGILNVDGYYDHLVNFLEHAVAEGFFQKVYRDMLIIEQSPQSLLKRFYDYRAPTVKKWPVIKK